MCHCELMLMMTRLLLLMKMQKKIDSKVCFIYNILYINIILPILYIKYIVFSDYKKQSTNKKNFNSALDRIADAFYERNKQAPITLPDPPQNDEVDAIVSVVEQRLRKLPPNMLDNAAQKLFQITYDLIKETEH